MEIVKAMGTGEGKAIGRAADILRRGGLAVLPTDTLYALSASALSRECVLKVYKAKGRDFKKPLSVMFHSIRQAGRYVRFNRLASRLARKFLPGPLTIILPMKGGLPEELASGSGKVGIRIPDDRVALSVLEKVGFPLTATSANISGGAEPADAKTAIEQIGHKVDLVIDGGRCRYGGPSTVVDLSGGRLAVVREGVIPKDELFKFCKA